MKHILLVVDGDIALHFLYKIINEHSSNNFYIVVHKDASLLPAHVPSTFKFYECDYTSTFRLDNVLADEDISDAFIVLANEEESHAVYHYLRKKYKKIRIICSIHALTGQYEALTQHDSNLILITQTNAIASRLLSRLPNVPIIPRGFGLEQGEVMEIGIPSGSIFVYRQVGTIEQINWKIVGIYRNNSFRIATSQSIIWPGDVLLVAGEPKVVQTIYNRIKSDIGQFPSPFGREIYLIVDMCLQTREQILFDCKEAIYLHRHLKSTKLTIKVLHATDFETIGEIEQFHQNDIAVTIDYENRDFVQTLRNKFGKKIGIIVVGHELFSKRSHRRVLWESKIPVFKTAKNSLQPDNYDYTLAKHAHYNNGKMLYPPNATESLLVVAGDGHRDSDISTLIFDISKQLCLNVHIYDFEPDNHFSNEVEDECNTLSRIFERKFYIERSNSQNPVLYLQKLQLPILHFLPFSAAITKNRFSAFIRTRFEALAFMIDTNPQFFLPINE